MAISIATPFHFPQIHSQSQTQYPNQNQTLTMASSSFLSPSSQFISSPKFSHSPPPLTPPSSVAFRQSHRVSASYSSYTERTTSPTSMYEVLGINMGASGQEIKAAYRKLARVSHPDVVAKGISDSSSAPAADEFIRIHAAYATLSDPGKRAEYDRTLFPRQRRPTVIRASGSSRYSGYTMGRNWETDQCW